MTRSRSNTTGAHALDAGRMRGRHALRYAPLASAISAILAGGMPLAHAAAEEEAGASDEIVVTAQKKSENLQNVPISISVFDTKKLDQLNIVDVDSYVKYSPSMSYVRSQGQGDNGEPGNSHIYIRGVVSGGDGNHSGSQPSVGTYFDEQPVTTIDGTPEVHIYDMARIEVLEGPQGTLYGASSEAGTVRIISNKPDPSKFAAGYDLSGNSVEHGGIGYSVEGFVNLPLSPILAVRLVGWDVHDAGFIDNVAGTNAAAGIVNGVRTFPTWAASAGGGIGAGLDQQCGLRQEGLQHGGYQGRPRGTQTGHRRQLDHLTHGDGTENHHRRILRLRPGDRPLGGHALRARVHQRFVGAIGADRRGQDGRFRRRVCGRVHEAQPRLGGGLQRLRVLLRPDRRLRRVLAGQQRQTHHAAGIGDRVRRLREVEP